MFMLAGALLLGWFAWSVRPTTVSGVVARAAPLPLLLAGGAVVVNLAVKAWRWRLMARLALGVTLGAGEALAMIPVGVAAGAVTPAHAVDLGKPSLLALSGRAPFGPALGLAMWERLFDLAALLVAAGLAGAAWCASWGAGAGRLGWVFVGMASFGVCATCLLIAPGPVLRAGMRILGGPPAPSTGSRAALAAGTYLALVLEAARAALVAWSIGWDGPVWSAPTAILVGSVAGIVSLVPGGIGVAEWSGGLVLSQWAVAAPGMHVLPEGAAVVLLDRLLAYYLPAAAGAGLMATWGRRLATRQSMVEPRPDASAGPARSPGAAGDPVPGTLAAFAWVILPAYDEARGIAELFRRLAEALPPGSYHVLLVDDGSRDGTSEVASRAAHEAGCPLTVVRHARNQGLPAAMRDGLRWAAQRAAPTDAIVCLDADNTQDPALIPQLLRTLEEGHDIAIASRYRPGAAEAGVPLRRRILSRGANLMLQLLAPVPGVRDYTSGYRAYRAAAVQEALRRFGDAVVESSTFACTAELLLRLGSLGYRAREVPLPLRYDMKQGASKIRVLPTVLEYLELVARFASYQARASRILLWVAAVALFAIPLAAPLTDGDSHYYAAIAQEMLRSGDWVTPRYPAAPSAIVDKPPLTLWAMALSFRLLGVHEVAARLWQVLMGLAILWLTIDAGRLYLPERTALRAGWMLLTSMLFWYAVLVPQQDVATVFFLSLAFWAFLRGRRSGRIGYYYLVCAAFAGELLTRGILGLGLGGAVIGAYVIARRGQPIRHFISSWQNAGHAVLGLVLFAALGLPWFGVEAHILGPDFVQAFFGGGNARFFSGGPVASGLSLVLGYAALLAGAFLPWSGWVPPALSLALRRAKARDDAPAGREERAFVLVWAAVAFALPHLIAWRVIRYLLPVLPPLALLVAEWAEAATSPVCPARGASLAYRLTLSLMVPFGLAAIVLPWVPLPAQGEPLRPFVQLVLGVFAAGAAVYAWLGRRDATAGRRILAATAVAAFLVLGAMLAAWGSQAFPVRLHAG